MGITRDNHFVPQSYLRRWSYNGREVQVYRLIVSHGRVPLWRVASVKGIAYQRHLYTKIVAGAETDEFEQWLNREFEAPAETVLRKLDLDRKLNRGDKIVLARFAAAQDLRTPARYVEQRERWITQLQPMLDSVVERSIKGFDRKAHAPDQVRRTRPGMQDFPIRTAIGKDPASGQNYIRTEVAVGRRMWLSSMRLLLTETIRVLHGHYWTVLKAPRGLRWPTSDDPVVKLNYYSPGSYDFKGGWGSRGTEILFPLSPRHLLYAKIGSKPPVEGISPTAIARELRRFIIEKAHRIIISNREEQDIPVLRPRVVDELAYKHERAAWKAFAEEQALSEIELGGLGAVAAPNGG